jgi:hypothetical protein
MRDERNISFKIMDSVTHKSTTKIHGPKTRQPMETQHAHVGFMGVIQIQSSQIRRHLTNAWLTYLNPRIHLFDYAQSLMFNDQIRLLQSEYAPTIWTARVRPYHQNSHD